MTLEEVSNLLDSSLSIEELLNHKEELLESDFADDDIINGLLDAITKENQPFIDRRVVTRAIITYICTTGDFCYFIKRLLTDFLERDGCSKEAITGILMQASEQAASIRKRNKEKRLAENNKKAAEMKKLEESIDTLKTAVSYDTARFLIRNGVTYEELEQNSNLSIVSQEDIDPLLHKYRISNDEEKDTVSIADVVGYSYDYMKSGNNLLKLFPKFFDSTEMDGYHTRSLSMLDLTTENVIDSLMPSFSEEPMKLADAPNGRYTINGNGMHRYSVLRSLYLIEMARANGNKEKEQELYEKYKIPALVSKIDYIKTYANYILTSLRVASWVSNERDPKNNRSTGRAIIDLSDGTTLLLTNEELLVYVGNAIKTYQDNPFIQYLLQSKGESLEKFLSLVELGMTQGYSLEGENAKAI